VAGRLPRRYSGGLSDVNAARAAAASGSPYRDIAPRSRTVPGPDGFLEGVLGSDNLIARWDTALNAAARATGQLLANDTA
jgi:hypothetical protein